MKAKSADDTISKIDSMIRVLSKAQPHGDVLTPEDVDALKNVDSEDQLKLAARLEDMIVFLKDEPDNKRKILEAHDLTMDEFGHVDPVRDALESVKTYFLKN
ncbi:MAG: hypothetical protein KGI33_05595 [Thaumarchaeota archaeon]|nr:hypothetical protein [Nitrososphaerota archaeon]